MSSPSIPSIPLPTLATIATSQVLNSLQTLHNILNKSLPHADSSTFPEARLHESMHPLAYQVHIINNFIKGLLAPAQPGINKWTVVEDHKPVVPIPELIAVVEESQALINNAGQDGLVKVLEGPHTIQVAEDRPKFSLSPEGLVFDFLLPNLYFHLNVAYAILRSKGVDVGKWDYLGPFAGRYLVEGSAKPKTQ